MKLFGLIKKIGIYSTMAIGTGITVACLGIGIAGVVYEKDVKNLVTNIAGDTKTTINDLLTQFDNIVDQVEVGKDQVVTSVNDGVTILDEQITNLQSIRDQIASSSNQPGNGTNQNLLSQLDTILAQIKEAMPLIKNIQTQINDNVGQIDNLINGDIVKQVKSITGDANKFLTIIQDPNGPVWQYYGIISKGLIIASATILGIFVLGLILKGCLYKKVDGVWFKKSKMKREVSDHVRKILKKYPQLWKVIDDYEK